jgi:hypothetical protein
MTDGRSCHFADAALAPEPSLDEIVNKPVRHWLLVQLGLAAAGWAVILLGIFCFV